MEDIQEHTEKSVDDAAYNAAWESCTSTFNGWRIAAQETRHSMCLLKMVRSSHYSRGMSGAYLQKTVEGLQAYQSAIRSHGRDAQYAKDALEVGHRPASIH
jgi:hypothetical protein